MTWDTTVESYPAPGEAGELGLTIEIHYDDNAFNPREEYDNVGTIVHWHKKYDFGEDVRGTLDRIRAKSTDELFRKFERYLSVAHDAAVVLPISMIDHSGISIWVARRRNEASVFDPGGWDSGQVGYIYCTREQVRHEWGGDLDKAENYLRGEIETYDSYLRGEVFWYAVVDGDGDQLDTCGGFIGCMDECKAEAESAAEYHAGELKREAEAEARNRDEAARWGIPTVEA